MSLKNMIDLSLREVLSDIVEEVSPLSAVLTGVQGEHKGHYLQIRRDKLVIGLDPDCEIPFERDVRISPRHAILFRMGGYWYCTDLGSVSGTFIGERRVGTAPMMIPPGGFVYCGRQVLRLDYVVPDNPPLDAASLIVPETSPVTSPTRVVEPTRTRSSEAIAASANVAWVPPGRSVRVQNFTIPNGMVYVGKGVPSVNGRVVEPALIAPQLKVGSGHGRLDAFDYWTTYATATPARRRVYLEWLASGRKSALMDEGLLLLFFYGIERRVLEQQGRNVPEDEMVAIRKELNRLVEQYGLGMYSFRTYAQRLVEFIDLLGLLKRKDTPAAKEFAGLHKHSNNLPVPFEVTLSRMAKQKVPLTAEYAYLWYQFDPEHTPRSVESRCPEELRRLFLTRFAEKYPDGIRMSTLKGTVSLDYQPLSRSFSGMGILRAIPEDEPRLNKVSMTALKRLHEVADSCAGELDAYSRWLGRNQEQRDVLRGAALLPDLLFFEHSAVQLLNEWLTQQTAEEEMVVLPATDLLNRFLGEKRIPTRLEATTLLRTLARLGFRMEPDLRVSAPIIDPADKVVLARATDPKRDFDDEEVAAFTKVAPLVQMVAVAAISETSAALTPARWKRLSARLLHIPRMADNLRLWSSVRLRWLLETSTIVKPPRKQNIDLNPNERRKMGEILVAVANLEGEGVTLAKTKELVRLFRLLEEDETSLYSRLHNHSITASSSDLPIVQSGGLSGGFAVPAPTTKRGKEGKSGGTLGIDMALVQKKSEESAVVSAMLAEVFVEANAPLPAPVVKAESESAGSILDLRHQNLLRRLLERDEWMESEFGVLAREQNLLPAGAMEAINDAAWDAADEPALEGEDIVRINRAVAEAIL